MCKFLWPSQKSWTLKQRFLKLYLLCTRVLRILNPFRAICVFGLYFHNGNLVESRCHLWHFIPTSKVTACYFGVRLRNWPLKPSWKDLQYKKLHTVKQLSNSNRKPFLKCILICQRRKRKSWKWYFVSKIVPSSCEGKNVLVIEKNFWNSRLKAENLQNFWDHSTIYSNSERSVQFLKQNYFLSFHADF